ncbi:MAG: calcium/sodium antiporter [Chloroflexota bacterium]|nr:calcium/sodium antiporter [Chloroflexota bacterium]
MPEMVASVLGLIAGLAVLVVGGNGFVEGAAALAQHFRVRPLIIGVIVIGFGTSAPEMLVSLFALADGQGGLALGNVVGSNIANIGLVLAAAAVITPVVVENRVLRRELPLTLGVSLLFAALVAGDGRIDLVDGLLLLTAFLGSLAYILGLLPRRKLDTAAIALVAGTPISGPALTLRRAGLYTGAGLGLILLGAQITVDQATTIARALGVSDSVIGLTVVAVGTSLPELVAALIAARKHQTDLILGNVLGSNLYNLGFTAGIVGLGAGAGIGVDPVLRFTSIGMMILFTIVLLPLLRRGHRLDRLEGSLLLLAYLVYTVLLF